MGQNITIITLATLLLLMPTLADAKFYKYRDAKGVLHYTDNLAEVPKEQRPSVTRYKEADDALTPVQRYQKRQREAAAHNKSKNGKGVVEKRPLSSKKRSELEKRRAALIKEKRELENEQRDLFKFNYRLADDIEIKVHKKKIANLNKRIQAYEKKRQLFELELSRYRLE